MKILELLAFGSIVGTVGNLVVPIALPAQAQTNLTQPATQPEQSEQPDVNPLSSQPQLEPGEPDRLPAGFGGPLEVDQQQTDQFFAPQPAQPVVQNRALPNLSTDDLLGPPPGSQTADELTPGQQLSIPIR